MRNKALKALTRMPGGDRRRVLGRLERLEENPARRDIEGDRTMTKLQKIPDADGQPEFAVIPWREYQRLAASDDDAALTDEERRDLAAAENDEFFPIDTVKRLLGGEHPVRVFRTYRKLTQKQLAAKAGINAIYLSQIERGRRTGSARLLAALARVLKVDVDNLLAVE